jgi:hypothetical protein
MEGQIERKIETAGGERESRRKKENREREGWRKRE